MGTEPSGPLAYAPGLELRHPTMSTFLMHGGRSDIEREIKFILCFFHQRKMNDQENIWKIDIEYCF